MDAPFRRFFKELGIPVQMLNDREKVNRCTSQVGVHSVVRGGNTFKKMIWLWINTYKYHF